MASYYYLIASLPELKADGEMPITYSEFLTCCQSNVSDAKYQLLEDGTASITGYKTCASLSKNHSMKIQRMMM